MACSPHSMRPEDPGKENGYDSQCFASRRAPTLVSSRCIDRSLALIAVICGFTTLPDALTAAPSLSILKRLRRRERNSKFHLRHRLPFGELPQYSRHNSRRL
jgi:hypothetical protein